MTKESMSSKASPPPRYFHQALCGLTHNCNINWTCVQWFSVLVPPPNSLEATNFILCLFFPADLLYEEWLFLPRKSHWVVLFTWWKFPHLCYWDILCQEQVIHCRLLPNTLLWRTDLENLLELWYDAANPLPISFRFKDRVFQSFGNDACSSCHG